MYLVAIFLAFSLAFSALPSVNFLSVNPSPLHSGQIPEPPQSSQGFEGASVTSEALVLLTRRVAAAPTTVAATATEAAVSASAEDTTNIFSTRPFNLTGNGTKEFLCNV